MGQGIIRKQPRLNGFQQKKAKLEQERKRRRRAKLARKGISYDRANNWTDRKAQYKEYAKQHKSTKQGSVSLRRENFDMYDFRNSIRERDERKKVREIRRWLVKTKGKRCAICGLPITKPEDLTVDHIIPRSQGGQTVRENCQLAHKLCNLLKDNDVSIEKLDN